MPNDQGEQFKLSLQGLGISIEKHVDQATAAAVVAIVMGGQVSPAANQTVGSAPDMSLGAGSNMSLREFLIEVSPNTNVHRIAAIGVYHHRYKSQESFSKEDIEAGFRKAREPLPSNLSRDISSCVKAGLIDETEERGHYYVTNTGERSLTDSSPNVPKARRQKSRPKSTSSTSASSKTDDSDKSDKKKKSSVGDLRPMLDDWVTQGFFDAPQTIKSILVKYHENAIIVKQTSLSGLLLRAVKDGLLTRSKIEQDGKLVWGYSKA